MWARVGNHPADESIEEYVLGRLRGSELEEFESHLLVCEHCQDRVAEEDETAAAIKQAAALLEREEPLLNRSRTQARPGSRFGWFSRPVWIGAVAAAALSVAVWLPRDRAEPSYREVSLELTRGPVTESAWAPAGKPLMLNADLTGVPVEPGYRMEIVDRAGSSVLSREVVRQGEAARLRVPVSLPAGAYWVRILDTRGRLLREFALETR